MHCVESGGRQSVGWLTPGLEDCGYGEIPSVSRRTGLYLRLGVVVGAAVAVCEVLCVQPTCSEPGVPTC